MPAQDLYLSSALIVQHVVIEYGSDIGLNIHFFLEIPHMAGDSD